ncbi:MAG: hypothetical protein ACT4PT_07100, partial [Methanobacteriota archaeon]
MSAATSGLTARSQGGSPATHPTLVYRAIHAAHGAPTGDGSGSSQSGGVAPPAPNTALTVAKRTMADAPLAA